MTYSIANRVSFLQTHRHVGVSASTLSIQKSPYISPDWYPGQQNTMKQAQTQAKRPIRSPTKPR